ncbi:coiled-coil domain-containing protein [Brachionus plicatilis]|uniref:Coiled-coil domain-containing protein n=1 Tax=Brachionus plicatilis TaxID=10195 RepID=A0A3M7QNF2_BRAPC|nr:coiled-coil domain-containing protein [Brachionus plicatilis]
MYRKKREPPELTNYDLSPFMPHNLVKTTYENETIETLQQKLHIKTESLQLLNRQLEQCNKEKTEYKRLIDQLYEKNLSLKKTLFFKENSPEQGDYSSNLESSSSLFSDIDCDDYTRVLKDLVKSLQKERSELIRKNEDLSQQLVDYKADLKLLREQNVRQRVGTYLEGLTLGDFNSSPEKVKSTMSTSISFSCINDVRQSLIKEIEELREQNTTIENDLKMALCQKEELEIERDSFKDKYFKLNNFVEDSSSHLGIRVDELVSKNKYLSDMINNLKEEIGMLRQNGKKSTDINQKLHPISNYKQKVDFFIQNNHDLGQNLAALLDESKCVINLLVDGLNDKLVAFQHQKKVNKMLASRVQDLEKQINILNNGELSNDTSLLGDSPSMNKLPEPLRPSNFKI